MKTSIYTRLSINIVAIFGIAILMSLVPDHNKEFFGDWQCAGGSTDYDSIKQSYVRTGCMYGPSANNHGPTLHWGYRHWLWMLGGLVLFGVQTARVIELINKNDKK